MINIFFHIITFGIVTSSGPLSAFSVPLSVAVRMRSMDCIATAHWGGQCTALDSPCALSDVTHESLIGSAVLSQQWWQCTYRIHFHNYLDKLDKKICK